jgi:hypothetical protein
MAAAQTLAARLHTRLLSLNGQGTGKQSIFDLNLTSILAVLVKVLMLIIE